jgi:hypothetical protein
MDVHADERLAGHEESEILGQIGSSLFTGSTEGIVVADG